MLKIYTIPGDRERESPCCIKYNYRFKSKSAAMSGAVCGAFAKKRPRWIWNDLAFNFFFHILF